MNLDKFNDSDMLEGFKSFGRFSEQLSNLSERFDRDSREHISLNNKIESNHNQVMGKIDKFIEKVDEKYVRKEDLDNVQEQIISMRSLTSKLLITGVVMLFGNLVQIIFFLLNLIAKNG